jgi:hypothetical protein
VKHIAQEVNLTFVPQDDLKKYHDSGTRKRHHALIRKYRKIHTMRKVSSTKDDSADFINAAIDG